MENNFLLYNEASALKQLGFNDTCVAYFTAYKELRFDYIGFPKNTDTSFIISNYITAPLYTQAIKWFRKHKKLSGSTKHYASGSFTFEIQKHNGDATGWTKLTDFLNKSYYTEEDAQLALIQKLIEYSKDIQ